MKKLIENWLLLNKVYYIKKGYRQLTIIVLLVPCLYFGQITNYVNNGSFEDLRSCNLPNIITQAKFWNGIDSLNGGWAEIANTCYSNVPQNGVGFQWPKKGNSYVRSGFFCPPPSCSPDLNRIYLKNRMKSNLQANKTYCVKFYVNIFNASTYGMDGFAAFFGDNSLDTIQKFGIPLTYLIPQIQNPNNNIITDTLGWTLITGTFVATGNEKFMVIGNFKSDAATNTVLINPTNLPAVATDVCIDDVSCIDINLSAFAGKDTTCVPGTTIYIGRTRDAGIDEACKWFKLPTTITPTTSAIDTAAGIYVSPLITSTYVVRQEVCGIIKYDTIVVYKDGVGIEKLNLLQQELKLYPVPAGDYLELSINNEKLVSDFKSLMIYNDLGQILREEEIIFKNKKISLKINELPEGIYSIRLKSNTNQTVSKRFVIAR